MQENNHITAVVIILLLLVLGLGSFIYLEYYPGLKPAITDVPKQVKNKDQDQTSNPKGDEQKPDETNQEDESSKDQNKKKKESEQKNEKGINETNIPLSVPSGFKIEVLTNKVPEARDIEVGPRGNLWVSRTDRGAITLIELGKNGVKNVIDVFEDLNNPHGIVFHPQEDFTLYFAEEDKISKVRVYSGGNTLEKVADLPEGGRHYTRSLSFGPDNNLYVSIGSTCDVCFEENKKHGTIQIVNTETGELEPYATGLRNAVFFGWSYVDGSMWATEMGRDHLGDNLPPDEINIVKKGKDYGWPVCYGDNTYDTKFDGRPNEENPCEDKEPSYINLQAHVAPLGFDFVPEEGWPEKYWYDMLVAYHGSWNRSTPVGYKIKRIKLNAQGNFEGREDFISGWLAEDNSSYGRPVDVEALPGGMMYITDDKAGVVYKVTRINQSENGNDKVGQEDDDSNETKFSLSNLEPNSLVPKIFTIKGEAPGTWFFEGSFSVEAYNTKTGDKIATSVVEAQSDWMTTSTVPFSATVDLREFDGSEVRLKFKKSNPSGLEKNEASKSYKFRLEQAGTKKDGNISKGISKDGCVISGCSNQICADKGKVSTCQYKPEHQCYRTAVCAKNDQGDCSWIKNEGLKQCLSKFK
ncbi:MAG: sorbosone dehydrogenase family protein [Candidatus Magasanikbacteria bacterium]